MFGLGEKSEDDDARPLTKYVDSLKNRLKESFSLASEAANRARQKQKKYYDLKYKEKYCEVDDLMLQSTANLNMPEALSRKLQAKYVGRSELPIL